jgi:hypothetical protein
VPSIQEKPRQAYAAPLDYKTKTPAGSELNRAASKRFFVARSNFFLRARKYVMSSTGFVDGTSANPFKHSQFHNPLFKLNRLFLPAFRT